MEKKVVIISSYYPPEMGAASNRIKNLSNKLKEIGNNVEVICPIPNYPFGKVFQGYRRVLFRKEIIENIQVRRCWILPSKSENALSRFLSMFSFASSLWVFNFFYFLRQKPDFVIVQSPPLLVAFSSLVLSKLLRFDVILNVSDLWPKSALDLGAIKKGRLYKFLEKIEKFNYRFSEKIITQSEESKKYINSKFPSKEILVYRNVPKLNSEKNITRHFNNNLKVVYAGLLGKAQGIYEVCEKIDFDSLNVEFHIYGDGIEKEKINLLLQNKNLNNVYFHGVVSPEQLKVELVKYDVALVSLKYHIFGAVPSKIFEIISFGKPILYIGAGEGERIIREFNIGLCSKPNDHNGLLNNIKKLQMMPIGEYKSMSNNCYDMHKKEYNLDEQFNKLIDFIK